MEDFNFETPRLEKQPEALEKSIILEKNKIEDESAKKYIINTLENSIEALRRQVESANNDSLKRALEVKLEEKKKELGKISNTETIH